MTRLSFALLCLATACGSVSSVIDAPEGNPDGDLAPQPDGDPGQPADAALPDAGLPDPPDAAPPDAMVVAFCGDGEVNQATEVCDLGPANSSYGRCGANCRWGAGLDGTIGTTWETLASGPYVYAAQELHYSGAPFVHELQGNQRYDLAANTWAAMPVALPTSNSIWGNPAVSPDALWYAREGNMHRYDLALETWTTPATGIPNGSGQLSAHAFDGDGFIWYHAPGDDLVRFNPADNTYTIFTHPTHEMYETRVIYDPVTNSILSAGFLATSFQVFDIDTETFTTSAASPGGIIRDHTCGDRSGHVYTGADDASVIWQLDVATGAWTSFATPMPHDNNSTCVVSEDGFYYFATSGQWFRISLGTHP